MKNTVGPSVGRLPVCAVFAMTLAVAIMNDDSALPSATWPHEPTGFSAITDWGFPTLEGSGWQALFNYNCVIVTDGTAPFSPTAVLSMTRPQNQPGGCKYNFNFPGGVGYTEIYVGYRWKASNPYWGWANANNKQMGVVNASNTASTWVRFVGPNSGPYGLVMYLSAPSVGCAGACADNSHLPGWGDRPGTWNLSPNLASGALSLGTWHFVEFYFKQSTNSTSYDGIVRWWLDGVAQGNYTNVNFPNDSGHYTSAFLGPSWDSGDPTQPAQTDEQRWDHIHISAIGGQTSSDTTPPTPPARLTVQ